VEHNDAETALAVNNVDNVVDNGSDRDVLIMMPMSISKRLWVQWLACFGGSHL
jgi:hypothetical protein